MHRFCESTHLLRKHRHFCLQIRNIRRRRPVSWLLDAAKYQDSHTILSDPWASGPYPENSHSYTDEKPMEMARKQRIFDDIPLDKRSVVLFPGQGAQFVGMGQKLAHCTNSRLLFERAERSLGYDLWALCSTGPKDQLDRTIYCQPAVFVTSLAAVESVREKRPELIEDAVATAGFSVGEYAALVFSGALTFEQGLKLVQARAISMQKASELCPSGLVTVQINAKSQLRQAMNDAKRHACRVLDTDAVCQIANYLFQGTRVVGGNKEALEFLENHANDYHIQIVRHVAVSGAFHTSLMSPALPALVSALASCPFDPPRMPVYSNVTGRVHSQNRLRTDLADQLNRPVRWEQIQQAVLKLNGIGAVSLPRVVEFGPGRQLGAMLHFISKKLKANLTSVPV